MLLSLTKPGPNVKPQHNQTEIESMGCSPSKVLSNNDFATLDDVARLERLLGISLDASLDEKKRVLGAIDAWFKNRFHRPPLKMVDMTHAIAHDGTVDPALVGGLNGALGVAISLETTFVANKTLEAVMEALDSLHLRVLPKACLGFAGLYRNLGDQEPLKFAHEHGCRHFDLHDPLPKDVTEMMGPMASEFNLHNAPEKAGQCWAEFKGLDLSDTIITSYNMNMITRGNEHKASPKMVREGFDRLRRELKASGFTAEHAKGGQPLIDIYVIAGMSVMSFPDFRGYGCFSDFYKEAEKLVDEGYVRALALNNCTIHQIESTLEFCRHRPVMATFEQHLLNHCPEMVAFCKDKKIAPRAHVSLAKGDVFELPCCVRDDMSPAQAAIKWHIQQDVAACFGVDTLEHIIEDFKVPSMMDLPPVVCEPPAKPLLKLYPMFSMNMPGTMMQYGTREDTGIFRKDENGKYWCCSSKDHGTKWQEALDNMTEGQESLLRELDAALSGIQKAMKPPERRVAIDTAIKALGGEKTAPKDAKEIVSTLGDAFEKAQAAGSDVHDDPEVLSAFHQISEGGAKAGLTTMVCVPLSAFLKHGAIPRRSVYNTQNTHVPVSSLKPEDHILFFSQRWLTPSPRAIASPDDANKTKYKQVLAACAAYGKAKNVANDRIFVWLDFCCVDQDDEGELVKGVNSLALYVSSSSAFISIDHEDYFDRGWCLMECMFADSSKTPRYIFTKQGELAPMDPTQRLACKTPQEGSFTVESDREIMNLLEKMAQSITTRIERGGSLSILDRLQKGAEKEQQAAAMAAAEEEDGGEGAVA